MAYLINRNPAARLECLHALCRLIHKQFPYSFRLNDAKFDRDRTNIHEFCSMLSTASGLKFCPYKESPVDKAGCSLTNGILSDTTKSKEVSNTVKALHALGFVKREDRKCRLTADGAKFATTDYNSEEMLQLIRKAILNYGPAVGILNQLKKIADDDPEFSTSDIHVGYPATREEVEYKGKTIVLSVGSQQDSNIRTKSCMLAWLTTAGFIYPKKLGPYDNALPQILYRDYVNQSFRGDERYVYTYQDALETMENHIVDKPLDYNNLTKNIGALREKDSAVVRECTMLYEGRVNNRRFAILYMLDRAFIKGESLDINEIAMLFQAHQDMFIISDKDLYETIFSELDIANTCGLNFEVVRRGEETHLLPKNGININELSVGAPDELLYILNNVQLF